MSKHIFTTEQLKATKWEGEPAKAKFLNDLANLVRSGFKPAKFHKKLYNRLSNCFAHIAHYDIGGFYNTWFSTAQKQLEWVQNALQHPCYGDPQYTYSDAELLFQKWLQSDEGTALIEAIQERAKQESISNALAMKAHAERVLASHGV